MAAQVVAEAANWLLFGGLTEVREEPDEERVPGIGKRIERETEAVVAWRDGFFVKPDEPSAPEPPPGTPEAAPPETPEVAHVSEQEPEAETPAAPELPAARGSESETPERKPFLDLPADPRPEIERLARALLEDGTGGGGGAAEELAVDGPETAEAHLGAMWLETDEDREERGGRELTEAELKTQEVLAKLLPSQRNYGTSGQDPTVTKEKLEQLADRFSRNPTWARFLELIGRISSAAWAPPARTPTAALEDVRDLETGDELSRILPSELAQFGVPELAAMAYVDFVEKRMLQIAMEGSEPKSRGPILVAIDMSISMESQSPIAVRGAASSLLDLALVLAMALVRVADVQNRKVFIVGFNAGIVFETRVHNHREAVDAMLFLSSGLAPDGGTNFDAPLRRLIAQSGRYPGGDMLFITDGLADISPPIAAVVNQQRRRGLRVFSLLLVGGDTPLAQVSDVLVDLRSEADLVALGETISESPAAPSSGSGG